LKAKKNGIMEYWNVGMMVKDDEYPAEFMK